MILQWTDFHGCSNNDFSTATHSNSFRNSIESANRTSKNQNFVKTFFHCTCIIQLFYLNKMRFGKIKNSNQTEHIQWMLNAILPSNAYISLEQKKKLITRRRAKKMAMWRVRYGLKGKKYREWTKWCVHVTIHLWISEARNYNAISI